MSSFLCFLCHSTVNSETNEEIREKYREVVGMHLCPDSHICHICCHMLNKLCLFKSMCLKRSLEYPVLFSEQGTINLQKSDLDSIIVCQEDSCKPDIYGINKSLYSYNNTKIFIVNFNKNKEFYDTEQDCNNESNQYVELEEDRNDYDVISNDSKSFNDECFNHFEEEKDEIVDELKGEVNNVHNEEVDNETESLINDNIDTTEDAEANVPETEVEHTNDTQDPPKSDSKKAKHKKVKKKSFEKIVLSYKEQKAVLDAQRKEKKYLEAEFKCHSCALGFLFKDTYQSHMVRHEESNGQYSCHVCGLRFVTQNAKCMHVILHSELYKCNKCGARVKRPHRNRHSRECWGLGGDEASCHLCGKGFKDANCLQQHLKRFHASKTSKRVYSCNVCGKTYTDQGAVRTHMIKHINKRFSCDRCDSTFTSPYTLNQHKKKHDEAKADQFYCEACNTWYNTRKSLLAHWRNTLKHQQTSFECPYCGRNCPNSRALSSHLLTHSNLRETKQTRQSKPKEAICHHCGRSFKGTSKLNRHLKEVCERLKLEESLAAYYEQDAIDEGMMQ